MRLHEYICIENIEAKSPMKIDLEEPCVGILLHKEEDVHTLSQIMLA